MPLTYDFKDVKDYKKKMENPRLKAVGNALIFLTMSIGIRKITEKNADKFFNRIRAYEAINGAFFYSGEHPAYITSSEIKAFIGLVTNASEISTSEFSKKIGI